MTLSDYRNIQASRGLSDRRASCSSTGQLLHSCTRLGQVQVNVTELNFFTD